MAEDLKRKPKPTTTTNKPSQRIINRAVKEAVDKALYGIGTEKFTCSMCGTLLSRDRFYTNTDPIIKTGVSSICKECARDIALRKNEVTGEHNEPTKESICLALERLDRPFIQTLYESSIAESSNEINSKTKKNIWTSYIKNVAMPQYKLMRWKDSDSIFDYEKKENSKDEDVLPQDEIIINEFEKNKNSAIRLLGYEPFSKEKLSDQPLLYSQLIGLLDASEDANDDKMRVSASIAIVRGFLQHSQTDDMIAKLMQDEKNAAKNVSTIKALQDLKQKVTGTITKLAEDNCISMKHNKNAKKGENTWTGKIKKIKDLNLREGEVNGFDIGTCKGMQQVMDMSNASIIKQIKLDDSDYSEIVAEQRKLINKLQGDNAEYQEITRIILRENIDLRDTLKENDLLNEKDMIDLNDTFSYFSSTIKEE